MKKTIILALLFSKILIQGQVGIGTATPRGALDINQPTTNTMGLVLPTNANVNNIINPLGTGVIPGTIIYDSTNDCVRLYQGTNRWSNCLSDSSCETNTLVLDCAGATQTGTLTSGTPAANVFTIIPYTGGDGSAHNGQTVASTGVTGLTATLPAGNFTTGNGSLTYTITGTPSSDGVASFAINIGGQTCTITRDVASGAGTITTLDCAGATHNGTLTSKTAASGVTSVISYTGGNGTAYTAQSIASTGITGLTATLDAGNFANGNGTLTYTITGTPSDAGTASFTINIGGQTCTFTRTVAQRTVVPPPTPGATCEGWQIPLRQLNGTRTGTADGSSISATVSGSLNTYTNSSQQCSITFDPSSPSLALLKVDNSKFKVQFNKKVSNLKVLISAINYNESTTFTLKRNGVVVTPTVQAIAGSCNGNLIITSNKVLNPIMVGSLTYDTIINIGNVWFDEIEFTRNITPSNNTTGGLGYMICVGSVQ